MIEERANRRLAAIVAADVAGFSRLVGADEEGTLARLRAHRRELVNPLLAQHGGRVANTAGDSLLLEFPSVVDALRCSIEVQAGMAARNADLPEDRRILFRVGINLGDVIAEGDDLLGDGVNVAARLEGLAEPGGIVISGAAHDQVRDRLEVGFADMGDVEVRNITRPVRAFRLLREGEMAPAPVRSHSRRRWLSAAAAAVVLAIAVLAGAAWWAGLLDGAADADPVLALPQGPKIVVLPFDNLSGDPEQDYFVDGLVEDLTTRLTEHGFFFVVARNSAYKYKGKSPDVRDVGRDLGVDYVVEGSVRRSADRIRVNAQLLNASDGKHVWARTFERSLTVEGVFDIQDELTTGISRSIGEVRGAVSQIVLREIGTTRPGDLAAFECSLLSWNYWETYDPAIHANARECLEEVVRRNPNYAQGWADLSHMYRAEIEVGVNRGPDAMERMISAADRAVELDPNSFWAHTMRGMAMRSARRKEDAITSFELALALSPNHPRVLHNAALLFVQVGQWDRGMALWEKAIKLDPTPPGWTYFTPAFFHHHRGEFEDAYRYVLLLKQSAIKNWYWVAGTEAYVLADIGSIDEARAALERVLVQKPDFAATARTELESWWWANPEYLETILNGLYKAGLPKVEPQSL